MKQTTSPEKEKPKKTFSSKQAVSAPRPASVKANPYQQQAMQTASPGELTLLLYNGCLKFLQKAEKAMNEGKVEEKNKLMIRAQNIIGELMITLKTDSEIGNSMMQMYDYMYRRLIEANVSNDTKVLQEIYGLVEEFRDTWKQAMQKDRELRFREGGRA
ncbi:flagellar export chaperone FliS [Marinococcus halophilus]|nr:flagellar export chaperone FliS [Marinococcus halophilus]